MVRHLVIFFAMFALGIFIAIIVRTARHEPYAEHTGHPGNPPMGETPMSPKSMDSTPMTGAASAASVDHGPAMPHDMAGMAVDPVTTSAKPVAAAPLVTTGSSMTVNTICPICGMKVNPAIAPATYQGKLVGFGCKTCPADFKAAPETYGPAALKNQMVKE